MSLVTAAAHRIAQLAFVDRLRQDAVYATRGLRRSLGFTATVVITFALGIGANAAIFSLLDRIYLRPPEGVEKPSQIRRLYSSTAMPGRKGQRFILEGVMGPAPVDAMRAEIGQLATIAAHGGNHRPSQPLTIGNETIRWAIDPVSANFLPLLGVRPAFGRFFTEQEDRDSAKVLIVSYDLWKHSLGGDSLVLGHRVLLGKEPYTIIGVAQNGFGGMEAVGSVSAWQPLGTPGWGTAIVIRLKPGVDPRQVQAGATLAFRHMQMPERVADSTRAILLGPINSARGPEEQPQEMSISTRIAGVAAIILLITVANVGTLLLLRGARRRREIAVRLALGLSRARLCWQLLVEGVLLAGVGAAGAALLATWGSTVLWTMLIPYTPWRGSILDGRVLFFTMTVAVAAGIAAALIPALHATRPDLTQSLKAGTREGTFQRSRLRSSLVIAQATLSVVLIVGAGLFVRSLQKAQAIDLGYATDRLISAAIWAGDDTDLVAPMRAALPGVMSRIAAMPGVDAVAMSAMAPMQGVASGRAFLPSGDTLPVSLNDRHYPTWNAVTPGFFATTGMRVLAGRDFATTDVYGAEPVMSVNESLSRLLWPGESPLGKCLILNKSSEPCRRIVGVVSEAHFVALFGEAAAHYYVPMAQLLGDTSKARGPFASRSTILVRARPEHRAALVALVQRALKDQMPSSASIRVQDFGDVLARLYRPWQLGATLFSMFGLLALAVATVGVYSVIAYTVSLRTHEMGVRVALGARGADVVRLVLGEGFTLVAAGVVLGVGLAVALSRLIASLLYGISPRDPLTLAAAAFVLLAVGLLASLLPAKRAAKVDPVEALRSE